ncbi:MAG TPA: hypothetical protein VFM84_02440, partial [Holophagaceae bacterium]|nr:hypothetical protein [Holophagaceae bacterium]
PALQEVLSTMLRLKAENGVDPAKRVAALCTVQRLAPFTEALKSIARLESVAFVDGDLASPTRAMAVVTGGAVALELAGLKDPAAEKAKLEKERDKLQQELQALQGRLGNARYLEKAPADEVEKAKAMAEEKQARLAQVTALLG